MSSPRNDVTLLLAEVGRGDPSAAARLMELVYAELRALAGDYARRQRADHTLQPTALVHEAFLKLVDADSAEWKDRAHFFAVAATAMRQILTDHARAQRAQKRGGEWQKVTLSDVALPGDPGASAGQRAIDLILLDDALSELAAFDARKHRIVEMRFFGGLTVEDVARLEGVSTTTVESEWRAARAWLSVRLDD
jgi:RNA polymerase sigma factor (TIGR02999 family)